MAGVLILVFMSAISCQTQEHNAPASDPIQREVVETEPPMVISETLAKVPAVRQKTPEQINFDPSSISKEEFDAAKGEVQALIETLNLIIREKDYEGWVQYLNPSYKAALSDPEFLKNVSESNRLKNQNIVLKSLEDYFVYVVVPSRSNDRVDDIEFISQNRVKAYTITSKGQRLRLYELEKTAGNWNIVN